MFDPIHPMLANYMLWETKNVSTNVDHTIIFLGTFDYILTSFDPDKDGSKGWQNIFYR